MNNVLITSPIGHTSTRLLTDILLKVENFHTPRLNSVGEFNPLHQYFINIENRTRLNDELEYDYEELSIVLDSYCKGQMKDSKVLIKMPYYPLQCLQHFCKYFENELTIIYLTRPPEKVIRSFKNRGEDQSFFQKPEKQYHYVKKLPVKFRSAFLAYSNFDQFIKLLFELGEQTINKFDSEAKLIQVNSKDLTKRASLSNLFDELQIQYDSTILDELFKKTIDIKRLKNPRRGILKSVYSALKKKIK